MSYRIRAAVRLEDGKPADAIADCTQALQLAPDDLLTWGLRGEAHQTSAAFDRAIHDYTQVIRLDPKHWEAYLKRAEVYRSLALEREEFDEETKTAYEKSVLDCNEALRLKPKHQIALEIRCQNCYALGQRNQALADATAAVELNDKSWAGYHIRGQCYLDRKDYEKASSDFTQAIKLNAKDNISYRGRGMARTHLKNYKSAFDDLTIAINLHKEAFGTADGDAHYYRGCLHNIAKNYESALGDLTIAIGKLPKFAKAYVERGRAYYGLKRAAQGKADYDRAVKLDPNALKE